MENVFFERGFQLFQVRKYAEALKSLQEGLQREPEHYTAKSLVVRCFVELKEYKKAEELNERLISQYPIEDELFFNRSSLALQRDDIKTALAAITEAIVLDPYNADYFGYKGYILLGEKEYIESLSSADEGLALDPNNVLALNVRAQALTKLNRKEEAQETIGNTLHQDPEGSFSHASVGWVQLEQGNYKDAMNHFKESLKSDPTSRYAQNGMLEAIKAKNFVYRSYLKYAFWISNMKTKNQWFFIIGIYLVYRFLVKAVEFTEYPYLVILIIVPYLLFALGGWIIGPLSSMILLFHSHGKFLLDTKDKASGLLFFSCVLLAVVCTALFFGLGYEVFLLIVVSALCAIIPLTQGVLIEKKSSKLISLGIGGVILLAGLIGPLFHEDLYFLGMISIIGLVAYTWIGNFLKN
ncbi:hypothetical protein GCM10022393_00870 [Aquimarina addita]|uniref:Tetratricopeptide repeat protein n=1 Tax=Aquimarina addita TaxID=870485 RepID=A0ABP7X7F7_9FLAO